jgi:hypothetical protein
MQPRPWMRLSARSHVQAAPSRVPVAAARTRRRWGGAVGASPHGAAAVQPLPRTPPAPTLRRKQRMKRTAAAPPATQLRTPCGSGRAAPPARPPCSATASMPLTRRGPRWWCRPPPPPLQPHPWRLWLRSPRLAPRQQLALPLRAHKEQLPASCSLRGAAESPWCLKPPPLVRLAGFNLSAVLALCACTVWARAIMPLGSRPSAAS